MLNYIEDIIIMGKAPIAGLITLVGSWTSIIGVEIIAQAVPHDPMASWGEFIVSRSISTLGVTGVLAFVIWWLGKDREKMQARHDAAMIQMKEDYEERIAKLESEIKDLQRYVLKRKTGVEPQTSLPAEVT